MLHHLGDDHIRKVFSYVFRRGQLDLRETESDELSG
jgi:hypothetical protein